jgi:hypothetical protein
MEAGVAYYQVSQHVRMGFDKIMKASDTLVDAPTDIRTAHATDKSQKHYCLRELAL